MRITLQALALGGAIAAMTTAGAFACQFHQTSAQDDSMAQAQVAQSDSQTPALLLPPDATDQKADAAPSN